MTGPAAGEPDHRVELVLRLPASPAEAYAAWTKVALRRGDAIGADGEQAQRVAWLPLHSIQETDHDPLLSFLDHRP